METVMFPYFIVRHI